MTWETHPVTPDRFEDFADVIHPNRRATHCWCLSHRLRAQDVEQLGQGDREQAARALCARDRPPGVVTYRDGLPVGWCSIGPRVDIARLWASRLIGGAVPWAPVSGALATEGAVATVAEPPRQPSVRRA